MKKFFLVMFILFAVPTIGQADGNAQPTKTEAALADQLAAQTKAYQDLKARCEPAERVDLANQARTTVRHRNPGLSKKQRAQVQNMLNELLTRIEANEECCADLRTVVASLDERITALENRVDDLEKNVKILTDAAAGQIETDRNQDERIQALEDSPAVPTVESRSYYSVGVKFKLRLWSETSIAFKRSGDFGQLPYQLFGGSLIFQQRVGKIDEKDSEKTGYLLLGLSGGVGIPIQNKLVASYATSGFLAYQWANTGIYLGGKLRFLVEGMNPSQEWFVSPSALLGITAPGPKKDKPVAFFAELFVGPSARLSGEIGWRPGWSVVCEGGLTLGLQLF